MMLLKSKKLSLFKYVPFLTVSESLIHEKPHRSVSLSLTRKHDFWCKSTVVVDNQEQESLWSTSCPSVHCLVYDLNSVQCSTCPKACMAFWVFGCPESDFTAQLAWASVYQAHSLLCVPRLAVSVGARRGEASRRGAVWVQGRCIAELCEPCFVSLCLFIAGEELFQSFREPAAKLYFLPRPCSRREASQPNGGRGCQAACAPAWVTLSCLHTQTHTHTKGWPVTPTCIDQPVIWTGQIDFCQCFWYLALEMFPLGPKWWSGKPDLKLSS